jgi:hypothetical protein
LESILSGIISPRRKFIARRIREFERLPIRANEGVRERVEGECSGEGEGGDEIGRGNERVRGGVGVIAACEVSVVRGDDWGEEVSTSVSDEEQEVDS